jgi:hypothetical protein
MVRRGAAGLRVDKEGRSGLSEGGQGELDSPGEGRPCTARHRRRSVRRSTPDAQDVVAIAEEHGVALQDGWDAASGARAYENSSSTRCLHPTFVMDYPFSAPAARPRPPRRPAPRRGGTCGRRHGAGDLVLRAGRPGQQRRTAHRQAQRRRSGDPQKPRGRCTAGRRTSCGPRHAPAQGGQGMA